MTFSRKNSAVPILFLIALLVFGPLLLLPKPAKASVPTHCTTFLDANCIKEYALDTAAKFVANTILVGLIEELTNWVKTGGVREGSLFVGDFAEHFERELNNAAGLFLEAYLDPRILNTICSPFRIPLGNLFNTSLNRTSFAARAKCTLSDVVNNIENFRTDFTAGGWAGWNALLQPQNNWIGSYLTGLGHATQLQAQASTRSSFEISTTGGGLLAWKECEETPGTPESPEKKLINCKIKTPGKVVADSMRDITGIQIDQLKVADEINELISAILGQLVSSILTETSFEDFSGDVEEPTLLEICGDGFDNDGDGITDESDCLSTVGNPELCSDGIDNDGDGETDESDCEAPPPAPLCSNGIDDDRDGLIDYPSDPGCTSADGPTEILEGDAVIAGVCGQDSGVALPGGPIDLCTSGIPTAPIVISDTSPITPDAWNWGCLGINGGGDAQCGAPVFGTGAVPVVGITANNTSDTLTLPAGNAVTLEWEAVPADSCGLYIGTSLIFSGGGEGSYIYRQGTPTAETKTFTATCTSAGLIQSDSVTVTWE